MEQDILKLFNKLNSKVGQIRKKAFNTLISITDSKVTFMYEIAHIQS